jgi:hypothetical protein
MREHMGRFKLKDGSMYYYDAQTAGGEVWAYAINVQIRGKYTDAASLGEPPQVVAKIREAADPHAALAPFMPVNIEHALADPGVILEDRPQTHEDGAEGVPDLSEGAEYP